MSPLQRAVQELSDASWGVIAYELCHAPAAELAGALQHFWVMLVLHRPDSFAGRVLRELGRRALERLARAEGVDVVGGSIDLNVRPPRRVLS